MNRLIKIIIPILLVVLIMTGCSNETHKIIKIYGSTTIEPFMKKATRQLDKSRVRFDVKAVGSNSGIDSLILGKCDVAMSSTELSQDQISKANDCGVPIKPFLLGYDLVIPIVHPSNTVSNLSFDQLIEIYKGSIHRWSDFGGADTIIDVVDREPSSGTYDIWHHNYIDQSEQTASFTISQSNSSVLAYVSEHVNAIGYVSAAYLNPDIKPLHLDGIAITQNDSLLSQYHLKRALYLYVNENNFNTHVKKLIIQLIINDSGRNLLKESGLFSSSGITLHKQ